MEQLPPTLNLHLVGHCNYRCRYCYARFEEAKTLLPSVAANRILEEAHRLGVNKVTFAGGEPTLHPDLPALLRSAAGRGLVTSLVSNGSFERDLARRLFPWLRWLVLSCDSHVTQTNDAIGRRAARDLLGQVARAERVVKWVREWNAARPASQHVRLKVNVVVNALNVQEDPSDWLLGLRPERVKLLQCAIVPGENDDAVDLQCSDEAFAAYAARVVRLREHGIVVVAETSDDLHDSYAMVDPRGRFRQVRVGGRYETSAPIVEVGMEQAWREVGGCDVERFRARGGEYDPGAPCRGGGPQIVALEGLDGSGKSTAVRALAERLGAVVLASPPASMREERRVADGLPAPERRAWYRRANEAAMAEATDHVFAGRWVVMDRCFASTAAYGAAEEGRLASAADAPRGVARPDRVFLLFVEERERRRRLAGRGGLVTAEEDRLMTDDAFRRRVVEGYRALGAEMVDASVEPAGVVTELVRKLGV
ncbi:MAG: radical SAM protein [Myxococcales bacterium]|nr:radical SAM protein [Myxococcales bacterium]